MHPGRDAVTPPSVVLHLMGSRQGNRGPPPPPPQIGCLCWLRHMGLAGPGRSVPRTGRWRWLLRCRSAAELQPLVWSPSPLRVWVEGWRTGVTTSGGRGDNQRLKLNRRRCVSFNVTADSVIALLFWEFSRFTSRHINTSTVTRGVKRSCRM